MLSPSAFSSDSIDGQPVSISDMLLAKLAAAESGRASTDSGPFIRKRPMICPIAFMLRHKVLLLKLPIPNTLPAAAADNFMLFCFELL